MKKTIAILLVFCLCVGLCACGGNNEAQKLDEFILTIGDVTLDSEQTILDAVDQYNALTDEEKSKVQNYEILQQAQKRFAQLRAFDTLKNYIKTNGKAETEGGVNNSDTIKSWNYNGIELWPRADVIEITYTERIKDSNGKDICKPNDDYDDDYAETQISLRFGPESLGLSFYSSYHQNDFLNNKNYLYAQGFMSNIMYDTYVIGGELPKIHTYSSNTTNMLFHYAPFKNDEEYGQYIREVIHNGIQDALLELKKILGDDMVNLGFSEQLIESIQ